MRELTHLLPDLDPPPGGLNRLRQSIEDHEPAPRWFVQHRFGLGTLALSALAIALILPGFITQQQRTHSLFDAMRQVMPPTTHGIYVSNGAAVELPSGQANVRIYLLQSETPQAR
ncbi:MAG: hypothetical protein WA777_10035 [Rhodanobacter sp.]